MSFERSAMSNDRTLMSVIRTSLSLISFGFTIFQFFHVLNEKFPESQIPSGAPRHFGGALIALGILMLVLGIWNHVDETRKLSRRRQRLFDEGLIKHAPVIKVSSTATVAVLLLLLGVLALCSVAFRLNIL